MPLNQPEYSFALYLISSIFVGALFRIFHMRKHCQYAFSLVGVTQIILFCGYDVFHFATMVAVATWMITNPSIKDPKVIFAFCLGYRVFFSTSPHLGFYRNEKNLANSLMLVATLKMILVGYEVHDYKRKKNLGKKDDKYNWSGVLELDHQPTALNIACYMTCFAGLFTGPIYKYKTYSDMINSGYRPIANHLKRQTLISTIATCMLIVGLVFTDMKYFTSHDFIEDPIYVRFQHIIPVGFLYQLRYVVVWLLGEGICMLVGLGMYPSNSKPSTGKGPTVAEGEHINLTTVGKETTEYDFKTIESIRPVIVILEHSVWKTFRYWNCTVQWWLAVFIYRSNVFPYHRKGLRAVATLLFSALWHGIKPGYFMCFMSMPILAFLEEMSFFLQRRFISNKTTIGVLHMLHWVFVKLFCGGSFFVTFMLQDYKAIWKFFQYTYFACYLLPIAMIAVNGIVVVFCLICRRTHSKQA